MMITTKAKSNCWTCKERKVGCDRALPECVNCTRSKRVCKGYGLKLAWPDKYDGRRKQKNYQAAPQGSAARYVTQDGRFAFLNTTFDDVEGKRKGVQELVRWGNEGGIEASRVTKGLDLLRIGKGEGALLHYYDRVVARMITTIDDNTNGFRLELIPMALSSADASSLSLLEATLALSSFHLGRQEEALKHKVKAIKSLSESFMGGTAIRVAQFAACMMLCVYSVFDASDTTWHLHLQGAKIITQALTQEERDLPCLKFLQPWFDYHETFAGYSHLPQQIPSSEENIVLPENTAATRKIIGLLGCSTELLKLISCTNQLRVLPRLAHRGSPPFNGNPPDPFFLIRERLINLKQEIHIEPSESAGTISHKRITLTAELYRVAALLYLYELAPPSSINPYAVSETEILPLVKAAFVILDQIGICTSPWPLFIVACNASQDSDRIKVMGVIEKGARERKVGNYSIIKSLVQSVWKQRDLAADEKERKEVDWRDYIEDGDYMPSFI